MVNESRVIQQELTPTNVNSLENFPTKNQFTRKDQTDESERIEKKCVMLVLHLFANHRRAARFSKPARRQSSRLNGAEKRTCQRGGTTMLLRVSFHEQRIKRSFTLSSWIAGFCIVSVAFSANYLRPENEKQEYASGSATRRPTGSTNPRVRSWEKSGIFKSNPLADVFTYRVVVSALVKYGSPFSMVPGVLHGFCTVVAELLRRRRTSRLKSRGSRVCSPAAKVWIMQVRGHSDDLSQSIMFHFLVSS